jgi:hypothetical protein
MLAYKKNNFKNNPQKSRYARLLPQLTKKAGYHPAISNEILNF